MNKLCECGCGREVYGKNRFIFNHHSKGKHHTEESRLKMSNSHLGIKHTKETKLKMSNTHMGMTGYKHTNETKLKISENNKGKKLSQEHKLKIFIANKGRKHTPESKIRMSQNNKGMLGKKPSIETKLKLSEIHKGKKFSNDTKLKLSLSAIKHIEEIKLNGGPLCPRVGKNEILILNQMENATGIKLLRNDHNISYKIGKFPDGYNYEFNLPIEVLENHHFKSNGELCDYDKDRELLIASKLACMIYYIPEKEFLNNPEKEIQRFKDFLELLRN